MARDICNDAWVRAHDARLRIGARLASLQGDDLGTALLGYIHAHRCACAIFVGPQAYAEAAPSYMPAARAAFPQGSPAPPAELLALIGVHTAGLPAAASLVGVLRPPTRRLPP